MLTFSYAVKKAKKAKDKKIKIVKRSRTFALIDAGGSIGQLVASKAVDLVSKIAKKQGIGMVGIYNSLPFLRSGSQAEKIAHNDLIGVVLINGGSPMVAAPGSVGKVIGTNPIGFALPTLKNPIVCDMAVSEKAYGEVRLAKFLGKNLPANSFIDDRGNVTTNPNNVFAALPFGGYKGFNLGILFEILTGSFVNAGVGCKKKFIGKSDKAYRGALFIAIDPKAFVSLTDFKGKNSQFVREIKLLKKRKGIKEILIPGERSYSHKEMALKRGWLDLDKKLFDEIKNLAN